MKAQAIRGVTAASSILLRLRAPALFLAALFAGASQAASMTVLHTFNDGHGFNPQGVAFGIDGNLYGSTFFGGTYPSQIGPAVPTYLGPGVIYKLSTSGAFTDLDTFSTLPVLSLIGGTVGLGGANPGPLASHGNGVLFYGTALGSAGAYANGLELFLFSPLVPYTVAPKYYFPTNSPPSGLLTVGKDGAVYGTTGVGNPQPGNTLAGTLFKLNALNQYTTLRAFYSFTSPYVGGCVPGGVIQTSDGSLYGVVHYCGAPPPGSTTATGQIFKLSTAGVYTVLHTFSGPDGMDPDDTLVLGSDGNIYGTAGGDGTHNDGTGFRLTPQGQFTVLHQFHSAVDGDGPGGLMQARDGSFYGIAGSSGVGTDLGRVFHMTADGTVTTVYQFSGGYSSIGYPNSPLVQGSDGSLYGTSCNPYCLNGGGVYKITLP